MSDIKHHLDDRLLMSYSAGTLPEAFSLVVATHISMCDECRARLAAHDAIGGALIEDLSDNHSEVDLDATWRLIEGGPKDPIRIERSDSTCAVFPSVLQNYVSGGIDAVEWRPIGMGVRQAILPTSRDATARLLHIPAGVKVPDHGHRGTELTLVLQGAFSDENDYFGRGDIEIADEDLTHTPIAAPGEDCICLAATDAPLRFRGIVQRIAQPFLKI